MQPPATTTCKNCGYSFTGNYCNNCGEKLFSQHDKSIWHLFEESLHFISHFEGRLLTTLKTVLLKPGKLSLDYCNGIQKKYYKPLSFFLVLMVVYLLFPVARGLNMPLGYHTDSGLYGAFAFKKVVAFMKEKQVSGPYVIEHFHTASEKVSKLLLLFIIPLMALWAWLLTVRKKDKVYFDHFIFCTEVNSFLVLWGFLIVPLFTRLVFWIISLFTAQAFFSEVLFNSLLIGFLFVFTFVAARRFYRLTDAKALLFALLFIAIYLAMIQYVYNFLLFCISFQLMH
jgi:hypothetical protein